MNAKYANQLDPVLVLGVTDPPGLIDTPLFAAVHVTQPLVDRVRHLYVLCHTDAVDELLTRAVKPPVYWDVLPHSVLTRITDTATEWSVDRDSIHVRLWGRLRMEDGSQGPPEVWARSRDFDLFDLQTWRDEGYLVALHPLESVDRLLGIPFAHLVYRRMVELELWPKLEPPP